MAKFIFSVDERYNYKEESGFPTTNPDDSLMVLGSYQSPPGNGATFAPTQWLSNYARVYFQRYRLPSLASFEIISASSHLAIMKYKIIHCKNTTNLYDHQHAISYKIN